MPHYAAICSDIYIYVEEIAKPRRNLSVCAKRNGAVNQNREEPTTYFNFAEILASRWDATTSSPTHVQPTVDYSMRVCPVAYNKVRFRFRGHGLPCSVCGRIVRLCHAMGYAGKDHPGHDVMSARIALCMSIAATLQSEHETDRD